MTFKAIAKRIGKSPTTISREVKHHSTTHRNGPSRRRKHARSCWEFPSSVMDVPGALAANAYIQGRNAQIKYRTLLVEAREGIPLNKEEFYHNEQIYLLSLFTPKPLLSLWAFLSLNLRRSFRVLCFWRNPFTGKCHRQLHLVWQFSSQALFAIPFFASLRSFFAIFSLFLTVNASVSYSKSNPLITVAFTLRIHGKLRENCGFTTSRNAWKDSKTPLTYTPARAMICA